MARTNNTIKTVNSRAKTGGRAAVKRKSASATTRNPTAAKAKAEPPKSKKQAGKTASSKAVQGTGQIQQPTPKEVMGEVAALMSVSPVHRYMFLGDVDWLVMPPIRLQQFRLLRKKGVPFAFVSWAYISDEVEERLLSGAKRLAPGDWHSGEKAFLIDVVAPFGGAREIASQIKSTIFTEREFWTMENAPETGGMSAVEVQPASEDVATEARVS